MSARAAAEPPIGFAASLRAVGATLNEIVSVRGALFGLELREEVQRRTRTLVLGAFAFAMIHAALLVVSVLVIAAFWDTYRLASITALAAAYLACAAAALVRLRVELAAAPPPFESTLREIRRDLAELRGSP